MSLVFGASITILVFIFAGISGGNINPAVSWALMLTKKIYGCLSIGEFTKGQPKARKRRARRQYQRVAG